VKPPAVLIDKLGNRGRTARDGGKALQLPRNTLLE
jgi:hypothetical protein